MENRELASLSNDTQSILDREFMKTAFTKLVIYGKASSKKVAETKLDFIQGLTTTRKQAEIAKLKEKVERLEREEGDIKFESNIIHRRWNDLVKERNELRIVVEKLEDEKNQLKTDCHAMNELFATQGTELESLKMNL